MSDSNSSLPMIWIMIMVLIILISMPSEDDIIQHFEGEVLEEHSGFWAIDRIVIEDNATGKRVAIHRDGVIDDYNVGDWFNETLTADDYEVVE